jgi:hypothetical protein
MKLTLVELDLQGLYNRFEFVYFDLSERLRQAMPDQTDTLIFISPGLSKNWTALRRMADKVDLHQRTDRVGGNG